MKCTALQAKVLNANSGHLGLASLLGSVCTQRGLSCAVGVISTSLGLCPLDVSDAFLPLK